MYCGRCGKELASGVKICPGCNLVIMNNDIGKNFRKQKKKSRNIIIALAMVSTIPIFVIAVSLCRGGRVHSNEGVNEISGKVFVQHPSVKQQTQEEMVIIEKESFSNDEKDSEKQMETEYSVQFEYPDIEPAEIDADLSTCQSLKDALDYMIIYNLQYNENLSGDPGVEFWDKLICASLTNSWFGDSPGTYYYSQTNSTIINTEDLLKIAFMITGKKLSCESVAKEIDISFAVSPYIYVWEHQNAYLNPIDDSGKWQLSYDFIYQTSFDSEKKIVNVNAIIQENPKSCLEGYSIVAINIK